jgi:hypothetical protein
MTPHEKANLQAGDIVQSKASGIRSIILGRRDGSLLALPEDHPVIIEHAASWALIQSSTRTGKQQLASAQKA